MPRLRDRGRIHREGMTTLVPAFGNQASVLGFASCTCWYPRPASREMSSSVSPCATRTFCSIPTRPGSSPAPGTRLVAVVTFFGPAAIGVTDSCTVAQLGSAKKNDGQ